jgi:hypothetical protein
MALLESVFCPCCTPALVQAVVHGVPATMARPMLWIGGVALATALGLSTDQPTSAAASIDDSAKAGGAA